MIKNKKILITGATGFIGKHLVKELVQNNNNVTCLLLPGEDPAYLKALRVNIHYGDITQKESLAEAVKDKDYIFHLAAQLGGNDTEAFYRVNFTGVKNLVQCCKEQAVTLRRFLFVSSVAVTGPSGKNNVLNEDTQCNPISDYGKSKLMAEQYLHDHKDSFPYTIVRLPLVYGPGSYGGFWILFKLIKINLVPYFGKGCTTITYVGDVVNGMIQAAENKGSLGNVYILANTKRYTMREIQNIISQTMGKKPFRIYTPFFLMYMAAWGIELVSKFTKQIPAFTRNEVVSYTKHRYWQFDSQKAVIELNFQPAITFEKGIEMTYQWYTENNLI